jgi:NIMA (never in mitosis gene a)-related kinase
MSVSSPSNSHESNHHPKKLSSKLDNYQQIKQIGSGAYGNTYLSKRKLDGLLVCLKFINLMRAGVQHYSELEYEPNILKQLNHPNIVQYIDQFHHKNDFVIVMEYIEGISLKSIIQDTKSKKQIFQENFICYIFAQIVSALSHCHSHLIIHRDIKPEHILITNDNQIKLIDFGVSKLIAFKSQQMFTKTGTIVYMSPEILKGEPY